jgi:glutamate carboxypeptidase
VIPDFAQAAINVRIRKDDQIKAVNDAFAMQAKTLVIPGAHVDVATSPAYPPLPDNAATLALAKRAESIYATLGRTLSEGGNGGASESALAAEAGTPALDGLGPVGGGFQSDQEYLLLNTVSPRLYMLVELLKQLGADPPTR